jgi:hypothetical protein
MLAQVYDSVNWLVLFLVRISIPQVSSGPILRDSPVPINWRSFDRALDN